MDLDAVLMRLAQAPVPASLDGMEDRVLARVAARPAARAGLGVGAMTIAAALVMGIFGAGNAGAAVTKFVAPAIIAATTLPKIAGPASARCNFFSTVGTPGATSGWIR